MTTEGFLRKYQLSQVKESLGLHKLVSTIKVNVSRKCYCVFLPAAADHDCSPWNMSSAQKVIPEQQHDTLKDEHTSLGQMASSWNLRDKKQSIKDRANQRKRVRQHIMLRTVASDDTARRTESHGLKRTSPVQAPCCPSQVKGLEDTRPGQRCRQPGELRGTRHSIRASAPTSVAVARSHLLGLAVSQRVPISCKSFLELLGQSQPRPRPTQPAFSCSVFCSGC